MLIVKISKISNFVKFLSFKIRFFINIKLMRNMFIFFKIEMSFDVHYIKYRKINNLSIKNIL